MKAEYKAIIDAGLDLQLIAPIWHYPAICCFPTGDDEFVKIADSHVAALNNAVEGLPKDRIRIHICWGNYEGPHVRIFPWIGFSQP